ncbi:MAG: hypothetical protein PVH29_09070 [Candidatus Zixiibacteriota bacterium]|jgi:hypothetical protein
MNKVYGIIVAVALVAVIPASCRKAAEGTAEPETATPPTAAETATETEIDIVGTYAGSGVDPDGDAYDCEVDVEPGRHVYWVTYRVGDRIAYPGVALWRGDLFVVGYRDEAGVLGVVAYTVNPDNSLEGITAYEGSTKTGTERLEKK